MDEECPAFLEGVSAELDDGLNMMELGGFVAKAGSAGVTDVVELQPESTRDLLVTSDGLDPIGTCQGQQMLDRAFPRNMRLVGAKLLSGFSVRDPDVHRCPAFNHEPIFAWQQS
jgi:hypothetical protein